MKRLSGILLIILSAACFGTLAIFGRYAYLDGLNTTTMLFLRFSLSAAIMFVILFMRRESFPRGQVLFQLIGMGALGYVGQSFSYISAIQFASAGLVALLLYLYPLFVAVLSMIFLHERITRVKIVALIVALAGTGLTAAPAGGRMTGILLAIAAAVIYSIYIIVGTDVMKHVSSVQSSTVIFASAGFVYAWLTAFTGAHFPASNTGWMAMIGMILLSTIFPVVAFLAGLERIGPTSAALLSTLEPVVTVLLAAWLFGERLEPIVLVGGSLILASVLLLTRSELESIKR